MSWPNDIMLANSQYMQLAIDHIVFASLGIVSINAHFLHKHFLDLRSSRGSVVNVTDLYPVSLGSIPAGVHISHWWWQEGHPAKIAPVHQ